MYFLIERWTILLVLELKTTFGNPCWMYTLMKFENIWVNCWKPNKAVVYIILKWHDSQCVLLCTWLISWQFNNIKLKTAVYNYTTSNMTSQPEVLATLLPRQGLVLLLWWQWVNVVMILKPGDVNVLLLLTVVSYDVTVDSKWVWSSWLVQALTPGGGWCGLCGWVQWWTSK